MIFGCKAMEFGSEVDAPEASFQVFFDTLVSKSGDRWPFFNKNPSSSIRRNERLFCKKLDNFFIGVLVSDSLKKTGFSHTENVVQEVQLNANNEVNLIIMNLTNYKAL